MEPFTGQLSKRRTRALFFNAEDDKTISATYESARTTTLETPAEVRREEARIDPYEAINLRNAELDSIRHQAAMASDNQQTLVRQPMVQPSKTEIVSLEKLPAIIRQAAEAALLKKRRR